MRPTILVRFFVALLALGNLTVPSAHSQDEKRSDTYQLESEIEFPAAPNVDPLKFYNRVRYTLEQQHQLIDIVVEEIQFKLFRNQKESFNITQNRQGTVVIFQGKKHRFKFDDVSAKRQQVLRESFGTPLCKIDVDETGKEVKRTMTAGPGAKRVIEYGYVDLCRLFHPPFLVDKKRWTAPLMLRLPNKRTIKGDLTYEKTPDKSIGRTLVKAAGGWKQTDKSAKGMPAEVEIKWQGELAYDNKSKQWITGQLAMDGTSGTAVDREKGQTKKIKLTFRFVAVKPE